MDNYFNISISVNITNGIIYLPFDYTWSRKLKLFINVVILTFGVVSNGLLLLSVILFRKLRTLFNVLLANLASADFILIIVSQVSHIYIELNPSIPERICRLIGKLILVFSLVSLNTFGLIALNRYFLLCKSMTDYNKLFNKKTVPVFITCIWLLCMSVPNFSSLGVGDYNYNIYFKECILASSHNTFFLVLILDGGLCVPSLSTIIFSYYHVFQAIFESQRNIKKMGGEQKKSTAVDRRKQENIQAAITLAIAFVVYLLFWTPVFVSFPLTYWIHFPDWLPHIVMMCGYTHSTTNPIIIGYRNKTFRTAYKKISLCQLKDTIVTVGVDSSVA